MARVLQTHPCQRRCRWRPTGEADGSLRLFACGGCASEWTATQPWTPCDADGRVPQDVAEERTAHATH